MRFPYFPFYATDWLGDSKLIRASWQAKGVLTHLLCLMHQSDDRGYLITADDPWTTDTIVRSLPGDRDQVQESVAELLRLGILQTDDRGALFSPRMVADVQKAAAKAESGRIGAEKRWGSEVPAPPVDGKPNGRRNGKRNGKRSDKRTSPEPEPDPEPEPPPPPKPKQQPEPEPKQQLKPKATSTARPGSDPMARLDELCRGTRQRYGSASSSDDETVLVGDVLSRMKKSGVGIGGMLVNNSGFDSSGSSSGGGGGGGDNSARYAATDDDEPEAEVVMTYLRDHCGIREPHLSAISRSRSIEEVRACWMELRSDPSIRRPQSVLVHKLSTARTKSATQNAQ